jgi:hypothetical protein
LQNKNPNLDPTGLGWGFYFVNPEKSIFTVFTRRKDCTPQFWMNSEKFPSHWMNYEKIPMQWDNFVIKNPEELWEINNRKVHSKFGGRSLR